MVAVAHGLVDGGRAALRTPSVAAGFVALFAHRMAFGASLLITVLLLRYSFDRRRPAQGRHGRAWARSPSPAARAC